MTRSPAGHFFRRHRVSLARVTTSDMLPRRVDGPVAGAGDHGPVQLRELPAAALAATGGRDLTEVGWEARGGARHGQRSRRLCASIAAHATGNAFSSSMATANARRGLRYRRSARA